MSQDFRVFDADSAVFEPAAIWNDYVGSEYRVAVRSAFYYEVDAAGTVSVIVNGRPGIPLNHGQINRQAIWRPGMSADQIGALDPDVAHPVNPGASDPTARLADMDAMGVDRAVLFPTLFAEYFPVVENPDLAWALARGYNDWIGDFASVAPVRLIPAAILPLQDVGFALAEAERVAEAGFHAVALRPAFYGQRYLNHPCYFPLFERLEKLDLAACIHPAPGHTNPEWTSQGQFNERVAANLNIGHNVAESVAPLMDNAMAFTAFLFFGHLEEYPELRVAFVHGGASWVPVLLEKNETYLTLSPAIQDVSLSPEEVIRNRPFLVSFDAWESSVGALHDQFEGFGAWRSRYPHHDAAAPDEAIATLKQHGTPDAIVAELMGKNAARFFGVE